jgi:hypothetical protein
VGGLVVVSLVGWRNLTWGDVTAGNSLGVQPWESAYDRFGGLNRLLLVAHRRPDLCGLQIDADLTEAGGASYLDRRVPIYGPRAPAASGHSNYVLGRGGGGPGDEVVATDGPWRLVRRPSACVPDPDFEWRLNARPANLPP